MTTKGKRQIKDAVVLVICGVWALNLTIMPLVVKDYTPVDLNAIIMAVIAALLVEKRNDGKSE